MLDYFLQRLRSSSVSSSLLKMFNQSVVASTIFFAFMFWGSRRRIVDTYRTNKLIRRKAGSVLGEEVDSLVVVSERRMLYKLRSIMDNISHPLHDVTVSHKTAHCYHHNAPQCTTERHRKSSTSCRERNRRIIRCCISALFCPSLFV